MEDGEDALFLVPEMTAVESAEARAATEERRQGARDRLKTTREKRVIDLKVQIRDGLNSLQKLRPAYAVAKGHTKVSCIVDK